MRSKIVLNGRFRVFENGTINKIQNGIEFPAHTTEVGRSDFKTKYLAVSYMENGKQKHEYVHRLVASAFIPNPHNKPEVNHKDGNKSNNDISNLEWVTRKENVHHAIENKLIDLAAYQTPCIFCGIMTKSETGCCPKCFQKFVVVLHRVQKANQQKEKYKYIDTNNLTNSESTCVQLAKMGIKNVDIARELGLSRQRITQILDKAISKQEQGTRC